jgi:hypothetical protein
VGALGGGWPPSKSGALKGQVRAMQIVYVQFVNEVSIGGNFNSISNWSREKHGKAIRCEEKGSYFVLTVIGDGSRRRVPLTNVAYVSEREEPKAKE